MSGGDGIPRIGAGGGGGGSGGVRSLVDPDQRHQRRVLPAPRRRCRVVCSGGELLVPARAARACCRALERLLRLLLLHEPGAPPLWKPPWTNLPSFQQFDGNRHPP